MKPPVSVQMRPLVLPGLLGPPILPILPDTVMLRTARPPNGPGCSQLGDAFIADA